MLLKTILGLVYDKVNFYIIKNPEILYTICKICLKTKL